MSRCTVALTLAIASLLSSSVAADPQNVPPQIADGIEILGHTLDPGFGVGNASVDSDPGYYSDGGAGGFVNGYHLLTLSDARTLQYSGALTHTVYAFTSASDPTNITILGNYAQEPHFYLQGPNGAGQGVIASDPSDDCQGSTFAPGPNTAMISNGNDTGGLTVWSVYCGNVRYNTLIEFNVVGLESLAATSQNIPAQRTVLRLFNATQPLYGTDGVAADNTYFYMIAKNDANYKIARVAKNFRTDVSEYEFYHPVSGNWNKTMPAPDSTSPDDNFFTGYNPASGVQFGSDLFFSEYFNTWIFSYSSNAFGNGIYNLAYSTSGNVEGPYHDLGPVFTPPNDQACNSTSPSYNPEADTIPPNGGNAPYDYVYLTHSHPGYDTTGKTLVVGWISCNTFTNFGRITFK